MVHLKNVVSGVLSLCICVSVHTTSAWADTVSFEWAQQFGTSGGESGSSVTLDTFGNAYLSGSTLGDLGGINAGGNDAYLIKYDLGIIPEPTTLLLLAVGVLMACRRRR